MIYGYGISGSTHDFHCWNSAGNIWNGSAFVAWSDGSYTSYRVTATEVGTSGRFTGTEPAGTVAWGLRLRGASLAASPVIDNGSFPTLAPTQTFSTTGGVGTVTNLPVFAPVVSSEVDATYFTLDAGVYLNGFSNASVGQTVIVASGTQAGEVHRIEQIVDLGGGQIRYITDRAWDNTDGVTTLQLLPTISAGPWSADAARVAELRTIAEAKGG